MPHAIIEAAHVDRVVVEEGRSQAIFVQLTRKGRRITVRLLSSIDPEKTDGVKRIMAQIAKQLREAVVGSSFGKTNLRDLPG